MEDWSCRKNGREFSLNIEQSRFVVVSLEDEQRKYGMR